MPGPTKKRSGQRINAVRVEYLGPWPMKCCCGRIYSLEQWRELEYCGRGPDHRGGAIEFRHCTCGSTRTVAVEPMPDEAAFAELA